MPEEAHSPRGNQRDKGRTSGVWRMGLTQLVFTPPLRPWETAGVPGLVLHPPRLPLAAWVLGPWKGGGEEE